MGDSPGPQGVSLQRHLPHRRVRTGCDRHGCGDAGDAAVALRLEGGEAQGGSGNASEKRDTSQNTGGEWKRTGRRGGVDCPSQDRQRSRGLEARGPRRPPADEQLGWRRRRRRSRLAGVSALVSDPSAFKPQDSHSEPRSLS